jgi:SPX domain protein involved in polyphosphate accumulation
MVMMELYARDLCDQGDPNSGNEQKIGLSALLRGFDGISLDEVDDVKSQLLTRVESKHLMTFRQCRELVQTLSDSYRVLDINDFRIGRYETLYYDNASFISYIQHHNGKGNRCKLRMRYYESSGETFLEVKKKTNKGFTEKSRLKTCMPSTCLLPEQVHFLERAFPFDYREFQPVLRTVYDRVTLVSRKSPERITFDTGISFHEGHRAVSYPFLVIGEIKYEKGSGHSQARSAIRSMGIQERGFSKYCTGVALLYDRLKHNRFKETLLYLSRLFPGGGVPC